ncbi:MAG TPA: serine hydrolase domain-containing protein [Phycisphaerales bacterium]|nr:serine hydrolase domain-containing protein [Phycisphaerales bacterium]
MKHILTWVLLAVALLVVIKVARAVAFARRPDPAINLRSLTAPPSAAPAPVPGVPADLADLLEPIRAKHKLPALAGAIVTGRELAALGAVGVRRAGGSEPVTRDDLWHLGSDTKAMTATMLAVLVEQGTLRWDSTVGEVFKDLPMDDGWRAVTLEQLLRNRGGAPADLDKDGLWGRLWQFKGPPREARLELVRGVLKHPPGQVGTFVYSNAGYAIAGAMAEQVTGSAWEDLMRERLFAPLGMTSVGFGAPGTPERVDQPRGHRRGKPVEPGPLGDNPPAIGPAGTVHCSISDWARFVALHLEGPHGRGPGGGAALLKPESFARLHAIDPGPGDPYAMGWLVTERPWAKGEGGTGRVLTHAGSNTMWYCVAWVAPERDFAVLVATNQGDGRAPRACDEAAGKLFERHLAATKRGAEMAPTTSPPAATPAPTPVPAPGSGPG